MGLWDNWGFRTCPTGQRYSDLLEMCVASDTDGEVMPTAGGEVLVNDEKTGRNGGKFWDRAPEYIDSLANLWASIKGQPVYAGDGGYVPPAGQSSTGRNDTLLTIGVLLLVILLIAVLFALRRKK